MFVLPLLVFLFFLVNNLRLHLLSCFSLFLDPVFVRIQKIPDSAERNDDKLYFFFREKSLDAAGGGSPGVLSRVGRVCLVGVSTNRPMHPLVVSHKTPQRTSETAYQLLLIDNVEAAPLVKSTHSIKMSFLSMDLNSFENLQNST